MSAGYSPRPLIKKLGLKPGMRALFLNPPADYPDNLGDIPTSVDMAAALTGTLDFIHIFTARKTELIQAFPSLKAHLKPTGMLWVSWPKQAAKVATDLNENGVRQIGLANGLVDVKVIAVDATWSGLKFVYRLVDRP